MLFICKNFLSPNIKKGSLEKKPFFKKIWQSMGQNKDKSDPSNQQRGIKSLDCFEGPRDSRF